MHVGPRFPPYGAAWRNRTARTAAGLIHRAWLQMQHKRFSLPSGEVRPCTNYTGRCAGDPGIKREKEKRGKESICRLGASREMPKTAGARTVKGFESRPMEGGGVYIPVDGDVAMM